MGTKVFAERGNTKLISDERDIAVHWAVRLEIIAWCEQNNIQVETPGLSKFFGFDLWRIKDEQQRTLFLLKWSDHVVES